ncbi:MAG: Rieske 2Fe-2S domain-containing protein [Acetobacteraceae bacterium]|nr:Rieske 2Fe-2S domain-containing protein [Acetobacteraceae bacterium]
MEMVLYRGESGAVTAFAAHCSHMGCHLVHGRVVGDNLQCALHHRVIGPGGGFVGRDGNILPDQWQPRFPVIERFGSIFVYAGIKPAFDLPAPAIAEAGPVATRCLKPTSFAVPWVTLVANGTDMDHLQAVHDRSLRQPATLEKLDRWRLRFSYRARATGSHLGDRLMKWLSGDDIDTSITFSGGSMVFVESRVRRWRTFVILSMCPTAEGGSVVRGVVGIAGAPQRLRMRGALRLTTWLFRSFLDEDVGVLGGMQWHEPHHALTPGDHLTRRLCCHFRSLPEFSPPASRDADARPADAYSRASA